MSRERLAVLLGLGSLLLILGIVLGIVLGIARSDDAPSYYLQSAAYPTDVEACAAFNRFDRYRYKFTFRVASPLPAGPVDLEEVGSPPFGLPPDSPDYELAQEHEGTIINPDKIDIVIKTPGLPDLNMRFLEGEQWTYIAGTWILADRPEPYNYSPALICHSMMEGLQLTGTPTPETVNGVDTTHYEFEDVSLLTGGYLFNAGSDQDRLLKVYSGDVWLTEDGWPVRLESKSSGTYPSGRELSLEVSLEITDVNSEDVAVERPF